LLVAIDLFDYQAFRHGRVLTLICGKCARKKTKEELKMSGAKWGSRNPKKI